MIQDVDGDIATELGDTNVVARSDILDSLRRCHIATDWIGLGTSASDGWDSDGIAPRDFLVGVSKHMCLVIISPIRHFTF